MSDSERFTFPCPHCSVKIDSKVSTVGEADFCPGCKKALVIPNPPALAAEKKPAPPPPPIKKPQRRRKPIWQQHPVQVSFGLVLLGTIPMMIFGLVVFWPANESAREGAQSSTRNNAAEDAPPDTHWIHYGLRGAVTSEEWSLAPSPLTWSTFTADVGDAFGPDTADIVWKKWTAVPTVLTLQANTLIRDEIATAVENAGRGGDVSRRIFDFKGFRFVVSANDGDYEDGTFVRIAFKGTKYYLMDEEPTILKDNAGD